MMLTTGTAQYTPPQACTPQYGQNTCSCGYQCYGQTQTGAPNPCGNCACTNCCGPACCGENGDEAVAWMNEVACDWATQYRVGSASCSGFQNGQPTNPLNAPCDYPTCEPITSCGSGMYQSVAATQTSNTVCAPISPPCVINVTYQTVAPTDTQNRVCSPVTICDPSSQYQSTAPTTTTDAVCSSLSSGLAAAISTAQVLAYNDDVPAAVQVLESMLALAADESSDTFGLYANASQLLINYRSGYSSQCDRSHYVTGSLNWDAPNGPMDQLNTKVQIMQT